VLSSFEKQTEMAEPETGGLAPASARPRATPRRERSPNGRAEAQLRARVAELEARLADVGRCLEAAESRAADRLALQAELDLAWHRLAVIEASRSWRLTRPLRSGMARVRRLLAH
jgi:hypothetical protein